MLERKKLVSIFVKENRQYSKQELLSLIQKGKETGLEIIKLLRQFGVLKTVKNNISKDLSEINDEDVVIVDVTDDSVECKFVFSYVGLIVVKDVVIKCFPKYLSLDKVETEEQYDYVTGCLKQVIRVLEKYSNSREPVVKMYNPNEEGGFLNFLAIILYLLNDYFENGIYTAPVILGDKSDNYTSGIEKTKILLNNYLESAKQQVATLPNNNYKQALEEFLELLKNV